MAYPQLARARALRLAAGLNPMAGVVEGFRWALLGAAAAPGPMLAVLGAWLVAMLLVSGLDYFRRWKTALRTLSSHERHRHPGRAPEQTLPHRRAASSDTALRDVLSQRGQRTAPAPQTRGNGRQKRRRRSTSGHSETFRSR